MKLKRIAFTLALFLPFAAGARTYYIMTYGAVNDGKSINTRAVQQAIDACTASGGGSVMVSGGGAYVIGTIYLESNVTLHVDSGTTLMGSPNYDDYITDTHRIMYKNESHRDRCLVYAENATSIAIEGYGTIDGNGYPAHFKDTGRPMLLRFKDCNKIHISTIRLINPAA